jgi:hypothetical protein
MRMANYMETISAVAIPTRGRTHVRRTCPQRGLALLARPPQKGCHAPGRALMRLPDYSAGIPAEIHAAVSSRLTEKRLTTSSI